MPSVINSITDLRALARRRVPKALFEYADRGSYDEVTLRRYPASRLRKRASEPPDLVQEVFLRLMAGH